jgi:hypothetical protein
MISGLDRVKTVPISCSLHGDRARMRTCFFSRHLVGKAVKFLQSFALHLQFHLRVLLEDLRVSLAKHLCDPLVRYPSGTDWDAEDNTLRSNFLLILAIPPRALRYARGHPIRPIPSTGSS